LAFKLFLIPLPKRKLFGLFKNLPAHQCALPSLNAIAARICSVNGVMIAKIACLSAGHPKNN